MTINIREIQPSDITVCGNICYTAFEHLSRSHNFASDFPNAEAAISMLGSLVNNERIYGVVAEKDGEIIGSNFLDERSTIAGVGPITVKPNTQNRQAGRGLFNAILKRAEAKAYPGIRLVQSAYNNRSLSLYAKLGFDLQIPLVLMRGQSINEKMPAYEVRKMRPEDLDSCNKICEYVHGHNRCGELEDALHSEDSTVVEYQGRLVGYSTGIGFSSHSVAESNNALKALISHAPEYTGSGFLVPTTNHELFRWCLKHGLRVVQVMNLMSKGLYNQPKGSFLSSIMF